MSINRRLFLKVATVAGACCLMSGVSASSSDQQTVSVDKVIKGAEFKWGMLIDLEKCVGCNACTMACKEENGTPQGIDWNIVRSAVEDKPPNIEGSFLPIPCMHCENPPCVEVCIANATYRREDGLVIQNNRRCIGCRYCQVACPYGRRYFNWKEPDNSRANPAVEVRRRGLVEKCTFCIHRINNAYEKGLEPGKDQEVTPACVNICPTEARIFGNLKNKRSIISELVATYKAQPLLEHLLTLPQVYYILPRRRWPGFD